MQSSQPLPDIFVPLICLLFATTACGGGAETNDVQPLAPCQGRCPAEKCVFNVCTDMGDEDAGPPSDSGSSEPDANNTPDAEGCVEDSDCAQGEYCDTPDGEDVGTCQQGCREDSSCDEGQVCEGNECVDGCRDDGGCGEGLICEEGLCTSGCRQNDDCIDGQICQENTCLDGCREDSECEIDSFCQEGQCVVGCQNDDNCSEANYCETNQGVCLSGCRLGDCPGETSCDARTRECVEGLCSSTDDCQPGTFCDFMQQPPICATGCDDDDQCGDLTCDLINRECVCNEDDQCPDGEVCILGGCAATCEIDEECDEGSFCDEALSICRLGCEDDVFEPNDSTFSPSFIQEGSYELAMCSDPQTLTDKDCYTTFANGDDMIISIEFVHEEGDLDLVLYNLFDEEVERSSTGDDEESIAVIDAQDIIFCVEAQGEQAFETTYSMSVLVACLGDEEDRQGDACETVALDPIALEDEVIQVRDRLICDDQDVDHVSLALDQGQRAAFEVSAPGDSELTVELLGADCENVLLTLTQREDLPEVSTGVFLAPEAGTYIMRVSSPAQAPVQWEANITPIVDCSDDLLEPNDFPDEATAIVDNPFTSQDNSLCQEDEDWFVIEVADGSSIIEATLTQNLDAPILGVEVRGDGGNFLLARNTDPGASRTATTDVIPAGTYFVRVLATEDLEFEGADYTLTIASASAISCEDEFEDNNTSESATPVEAGLIDANICGFDDDWYSIDLEAGERVTLTATYDHDVEGETNIFLFSPLDDFFPTDFLVRDGDTDTDTLSLNPAGLLVSPEAAGQWLLSASSFGLEETLDYSLELTVEAPICNTEDEDVRNDACDTATALPINQDLEGAVCSSVGDEDWFGVAVEAGQALEVVLDHFHFEGNIELELYAPGGEILIDQSYNAGPNEETVETVDTVAGIYCVRVFSDGAETSNTYTINATTF